MDCIIMDNGYPVIIDLVVVDNGYSAIMEAVAVDIAHCVWLEAHIEDDSFSTCSLISSSYNILQNNSLNKYGTASLVKADQVWQWR